MVGTVESEPTVVEYVAEHVKGLIATKKLKRGAPIPSYRNLARDLGVAYTSVKFAMDVLEEQGVVRRQRARGCYVNKELSLGGRPLRNVGIIFSGSRARLFSTLYLTQILEGVNAGSQILDNHIFALRETGFVTPAQIVDQRVDGAILLGVENDAYLQEFTTWGIPGVAVDHLADGIPLDFVVCDNAPAGERAVRHLVEMGHRRIRYVGVAPRRIAKVGYYQDLPMEERLSDATERRDAAIGSLSAIPGVRWDEVTVPWRAVPDAKGGPWDGFFADLIADWRKDQGRPTAFLTSDEQLALDLMRFMKAQGIQVPRDVSVCAVAGAGLPEVNGAGLTESRFDFAGMGRRAIEVLRERCERPGAGSPAVHRIGFEFVAGETVARVETGE